MSSFFKLYFNPTGRISCCRWWWSMVLFTIVFAVVRYALLSWMEPVLVGYVALLDFLVLLPVVFWCWIALSVKRLHDRDHSAWWMLWCLVPFVGVLVLLVILGMSGSVEGANRYGEEPS